MSTQKLNAAQLDLLEVVCMIPLADALELAVFTDEWASTTGQRLSRLRDLGLVDSVPHQVGVIARTSRYHPTSAGVETVAEALGLSKEEFLRTSPSHPNLLRGLVQRIDAVAACYRLALNLVEESVSALKASVDYHGSGPYDAMIKLNPGAIIGVMRVGRMQSRAAFARRWAAIVRADEEDWPDIVMILATTTTDRRIAFWHVEDRPGPPAYLALERRALSVDTEQEDWLAAGNDDDPMNISLRAIVEGLPETSRSNPPVPPPGSGSLSHDPGDLMSGQPAFILTSREKQLLDIIADWLLVRREYLPEFLEVSSSRISQMLHTLDACGLISPVTLRGATCYALSDVGLRYVSSRDRVALGTAFSSLSVEGPRPERWYGRHVRTLHRQFRHTDTVHWLMALLSKEARASPDYELIDFDPPRGAIQPFSLDDGEEMAVYPDAAARVIMHRSYSPNARLLLEMERRSVDQSRAQKKIKLYQDFIKSGDQVELGPSPLCLFVFETPTSEHRFLRIAIAMERAAGDNIQVPFATSNLRQLGQTGFLGPSWGTPTEGEEHIRWHLDEIEADLS